MRVIHSASPARLQRQSLRRHRDAARRPWLALRALCPAIEPEVALCFEGRLSAELAATGVSVHRLPEARASRPQTILRARRRLADGHRSRAVRSCRLPCRLVPGAVRRRRQARECAAGVLGTRCRDRHALDRAPRATRPSRSGDLQQPLYRRVTGTAVRRRAGDRADVSDRHERGCPDGGGARRAAAGTRHAGRCDGPHSGQPYGGVERPRGRGRRARATARPLGVGVVGRRRGATSGRSRRTSASSPLPPVVSASPTA